MHQKRRTLPYLLDELLNAVALPSGQHVVAGLVPLHHEPHPLDVVLRVPPVTVVGIRATTNQTLGKGNKMCGKKGRRH